MDGTNCRASVCQRNYTARKVLNVRSSQILHVVRVNLSVLLNCVPHMVHMSESSDRTELIMRVESGKSLNLGEKVFGSIVLLGKRKRVCLCLESN